jgi:hypothetical protein
MFSCGEVFFIVRLFTRIESTNNARKNLALFRHFFVAKKAYNSNTKKACPENDKVFRKKVCSQMKIIFLGFTALCSQPLF